MIILISILLSSYNGVVESHAISGQLYSSLTHMNDLFVFDSKVSRMLPLLPTYLPEVKSYKETSACVLMDTVEIGGGDVLNVAITGNPLHLFSVIKRLVLYWPPIRKSIQVIDDDECNCKDKHPNCEWWSNWSECEKNPTYMLADCPSSCGICGKPELRENLKSLYDLENGIVLPSENDLKGAALALARLQQIYRLPIPQLAAGKIANVSTCIRLTTYDCLRIANESHYQGEYANAWTWYNYAFGTTTNPEVKDHIKSLMSTVAIQHDERYVQHVPQFFPRLLSEYKLQAPWDTQYSQLCRGYNFMSEEDKAKLKCHVSSRGSAYLTLQPVKYEHLHIDPEMYVFYDILSHHEMHSIKNTAKDQLESSLVLFSDGPSEIRVSQTAWLSNESHPSLPSIARRIEAITGLHVFEGPNEDMAGEPLQVLSYGIGGHYNYHLDIFYKEYPEEEWITVGEKYDYYNSGDRMATWMFYLSEVEAGGRTAFPRAGVSVSPVAGSAVFWYSIKKNGYGNWRSEHGGCPVLLGHKWVANKWIRENHQFLRRPCAINADE